MQVDGVKSKGDRPLNNLDIPAPARGSILISVNAVARDRRNPEVVDFFNSNSNDFSFADGCGLAGTVAKVGEGVARFKEGDRVLAITSDLSKPSDKGFSEMIAAEEQMSCHIMESMSYEQACAIALSMATAGKALFQAPGLELSLQANKGEIVLVSGGATATGTMATQLLKMAGYKPIVTCSPEENALCESYGAAACFDGDSPACGADIRVFTDGGLKYVLDCVTSATAMKMCYGAIGSSGGSYIALETVDTTVKYTRRDVRADWSDTVADDVPGDGNLSTGKQPFAQMEQWLHEGSIRAHALAVSA